MSRSSTCRTSTLSITSTASASRRSCPRVDAVVWVTDPEKYHDAILHDDFLADWLPRLDRQVVVLNKTDRLSPDDAERVRNDLEATWPGSRAGGGRATPGPRPARLGALADRRPRSSRCATGSPPRSRRSASFEPAW